MSGIQVYDLVRSINFSSVSQIHSILDPFQLAALRYMISISIPSTLVSTQ